MGLLGAGSFKTCKFKNLAKLSLCRIAILNKQHKARCSYARSDVVELLKRGHLDDALIRVESVIREQNMLDIFTMLETFLHFLTENIRLIEKSKECPDELKEATSSLMFASSRFGEFPELLYIREMIYTKFGKDYVTQAVELQSNCSVNPKMIQKLSPLKPDLKIRSSLLKDIASENGIPLHPGNVGQAAVQEKAEKYRKQEHFQGTRISNILADHEKGNGTNTLHADANKEDEPFELATSRIAKKTIVASEQEAFQSAAHAAETAKLSVLSTEELQDSGNQQLSKHKANSGEIVPHDKIPLPYQSNERVPPDSRFVPSLNPLERNLKVMVAQSKPIAEQHQSKYPDADRKGKSVRRRRA